MLLSFNVLSERLKGGIVLAMRMILRLERSLNVKLIIVRLLLNFGVKKTKDVLSVLNLKGYLQACIDCELVEFKPTQKDLGVIVANRLNFTENCHQRTKKGTWLRKIERNLCNACVLTPNQNTPERISWLRCSKRGVCKQNPAKQKKLEFV